MHVISNLYNDKLLELRFGVKVGVRVRIRVRVRFGGRVGGWGCTILHVLSH